MPHYDSHGLYERAFACCFVHKQEFSLSTSWPWPWQQPCPQHHVRTRPLCSVTAAARGIWHRKPAHSLGFASNWVPLPKKQKRHPRQRKLQPPRKASTVTHSPEQGTQEALSQGRAQLTNGAHGPGRAGWALCLATSTNPRPTTVPFAGSTRRRKRLGFHLGVLQDSFLVKAEKG